MIGYGLPNTSYSNRYDRLKLAQVISFTETQLIMNLST